MLRVKQAGHTGHTPRKMECSTWLRQQNVGNRINMNQLRSPIIWIVNTHTEVSQLWLEQQSAGPYPTESSRPMQFGSSKFRVWTFSLTAPSHEADTKLKHGTACGMAFGKAPFVDRPDEHPRGSSRLHEQNMHCCGHVYPAACHFRQEFTWGGRSRWTYMGGITFQRVQTGVPVRLIFSREGIPCRVCFPRSERPVLLPQWHLIGESHCAHLMKPRAYRRCWCGVTWCPAACEALTLTAFVDDNDASGATGESDQDSDYECLGCYALGREKHEEQTHINASKKREARKEGRKVLWMLALSLSEIVKQLQWTINITTLGECERWH